MILTYKSTYKTVQQLPIRELPDDLTLITGVNGSGKTHFLKAIEGGSIAIEGLTVDQIKLLDWITLAHAEREKAHGLSLRSKWTQAWKQLASFLPGYLDRVRSNLDKAGLTVAAGMTTSQLAEAISSSSTAFPAETKEAIRDTLKQVTSELTREQRYQTEACAAIPVVEQSSGRSILLCDERSFMDTPPLAPDLDPFQHSFSRVFAGYAAARHANECAEFQAVYKKKPVPFLTQEQFLAKWPPPWEGVNEILRRAELHFSITAPDDPDDEFIAELVDTRTGSHVPFGDLSSGERVLVATALYVFSCDNLPSKHPALLLLDEVDAPLHPSMTHTLINVINDVIVGTYGCKVIMATHAPSTVALAPEKSIFIMDPSTRLLSKESQDKAVRALTAGIPVLSIKLENRRQVFVESKRDVERYEQIVSIAQQYINQGISLTFIESGHSQDGGCDSVKRLVAEFEREGRNTVFGLVDWDLTNEAAGQLLVLGQGKRRNIENYLFDPILIAALLLRDRIEERERLRFGPKEQFFELPSFDNSRLQDVARSVVESLGWKWSETDLRTCRYANGKEVRLPRVFLQQDGKKKLQEKLKERYPELQRYRQNGLTNEIFKILDNLPEFLPLEFIDAIKVIQKA